MTDLTHWLATTRPVRWGSQRRLIQWLWRYRWPGAPLTMVLALTLLQHVVPPDDHIWFDRTIVIAIVAAFSVLVVVLVVGTERPWGPESTGILLFVLGDLTLYGALALPGRFGWSVPWEAEAWAFLRANLAVGAPVLLLRGSDWLADWWRSRAAKRMIP